MKICIYGAGAIGGLIGVLRLGRLLDACCPSPRVARTTLLAWIAGNAFIGAQLSWVLRPFFGSPNLEVAFLRPNPMHGSFYESVWRSAGRLLAPLDPGLRLSLGAAVAFGLLLILLARLQHRLSTKLQQP